MLTRSKIYIAARTDGAEYSRTNWGELSSQNIAEQEGRTSTSHFRHPKGIQARSRVLIQPNIRHCCYLSYVYECWTPKTFESISACCSSCCVPSHLEWFWPQGKPPSPHDFLIQATFQPCWVDSSHPTWLVWLGSKTQCWNSLNGDWPNWLTTNTRIQVPASVTDLRKYFVQKPCRKAHTKDVA